MPGESPAAPVGKGPLIRTPAHSPIPRPMSPPSPPPRALQEVVLGYSQLRAAAYDRGSEAGGPLAATRLEVRGRLVLVAVLGRTGELLAAYDGMTFPDEAAAHAARLAAWLRAQHASWFA